MSGVETLTESGRRRCQPLPVSVLVVEDNPGDAELTRRGLESGRTPIQVTVARSVEEACAVLAAARARGARSWPRLIVLDLNLPGRGGLDLLAELKADPISARVPVVVLTTSDAERDVRQAYELKANAYLTKPMELDGYMETTRVLREHWLDTAELP